MARFTMTFLDHKNPERGGYACDFIGWDSTVQGEGSTEATLARDLNTPLSARDSARFADMQPGTVKTIDGIEYFREW